MTEATILPIVADRSTDFLSSCVSLSNAWGPLVSGPVAQHTSLSDSLRFGRSKPRNRFLRCRPAPAGRCDDLTDKGRTATKAGDEPIPHIGTDIEAVRQ
jgi:hypothetical protein